MIFRLCTIIYSFVLISLQLDKKGYLGPPLPLRTQMLRNHNLQYVSSTELQMTEQKSMMPMSSVSQSRIAAMKNVLADGRLTQRGWVVCLCHQAGTTASLCRSGVKGEGGRAGTALLYPPTTPIPHARPGVGYICRLWVLAGRYNRQNKRAKADSA